MTHPKVPSPHYDKALDILTSPNAASRLCRILAKLERNHTRALAAHKETLRAKAEASTDRWKLQHHQSKIGIDASRLGVYNYKEGLNYEEQYQRIYTLALEGLIAKSKP